MRLVDNLTRAYIDFWAKRETLPGIFFSTIINVNIQKLFLLQIPRKTVRIAAL